MKCYYEVLELERNADDSDIKKSYRKLALKWHPDKNPDNIEECQKQFTVIQQAYDTLIDPQERAFYDKHREQILRGGLDEHYEDNSLKLFAYFISSCYSGFDDSEKGFYTVYRHVFEEIACEDKEYVDDQNETYPTFGDMNSDYEEVVGQFYAFWQSFCTKRSFVWLDKYDVREGREQGGRFVVRAMEKENKKIREAAKKERNEEIRELVAFVRKRDKRVQEYRKILEERKELQQKKAKEHRLAQIRQRNEDLDVFQEDTDEKEARLESLRQIELQFGASSSSDSEHEQDDQENVEALECDALYCYACEKGFKSANAKENHAKSKKHIENVEKLKLQLTQEQVAELNLDESATVQVEERSDVKKSGGKRKKKKNKTKICPEEDSENDPEPKMTSKPLENEENLQHLPPKSTDIESKNGINSIEEEEYTIIDPTKPSAEELKSLNPPSAPKSTVPQSTVPKPCHCESCSEEFPSKSKLFAHLKESGHATIKNVQQPQNTKNKKKGANKKLRN